jgi:hypothetical protein
VLATTEELQPNISELRHPALARLRSAPVRVDITTFFIRTNKE